MHYRSGYFPSFELNLLPYIEAIFMLIFLTGFIVFYMFSHFILSHILVGSLWLPSLVVIFLSIFFFTSFSPALKILFFYISI